MRKRVQIGYDAEIVSVFYQANLFGKYDVFAVVLFRYCFTKVVDCHDVVFLGTTENPDLNYLKKFFGGDELDDLVAVVNRYYKDYFFDVEIPD